MAELGPARFEYGGVTFIREDMSFTNPRGLKLQASMWRKQELSEPAPCVVYTHGNASCRAEALQILAPVLASGASVFSFDFAGCGMSEGEYISLGWYEKDDLQSAIEMIRAGGLVGGIMLWGRSMGAVSAVFQASRDPSLAGVILDSPFASLEQVALELVTSAPDTVQGAPKVPKFLVQTALHVVAGSVKSRANFDLYKLRPVDAARTCFVPALFGCADKDILVRPHHSQMIYDEYAGDKNVVKFDGDHNDLRPGFFIDSACIFLKQVLLIPDSKSLDVPTDAEGRPLSLGQALRAQARAAAGHHGGPLQRIPTGMMPEDILSMLGGPARHAQPVETGHHALADVEEQLLRQAIEASLEAASQQQQEQAPAAEQQDAVDPPVQPDTSPAPQPSAPPSSAPPAVAAELVPDAAAGEGEVALLASPPRGSATAAGDGGEGGDEEQMMLEAAIRMSLQEDQQRQEAEKAEAPAGAPLVD